MKTHVWLILSKTGVVKMTKEKPFLAADRLSYRAERLSYPAQVEPVEVEV